eukprot:COSAG02_NODE_2969_length_7640_cov_2.657870_1_plen_75_part_00
MCISIHELPSHFLSVHGRGFMGPDPSVRVRDLPSCSGCMNLHPAGIQIDRRLCAHGHGAAGGAATRSHALELHR